VPSDVLDLAAARRVVRTGNEQNCDDQRTDQGLATLRSTSARMGGQPASRSLGFFARDAKGILEAWSPTRQRRRSAIQCA
jgi:hypothetical protein